MHVPLSKFLAQVARKGSWYGGGSVAALSVGLSAALLEKLIHDAPVRRQLQRIRRQSLRLTKQDATTFAKVIAASRTGHPGTFRRTLKAAIEIPCQVHEQAQAVQMIGRRAQRAIKPRFQSDIRCALALSEAGRAGAAAFIETNLAWLNDRAYAARIRRRLRRRR